MICCETPEHIFKPNFRSANLLRSACCLLSKESQHAFYRWIKQNWLDLFPSLPERTTVFSPSENASRNDRRISCRTDYFRRDRILRHRIVCHPIREVHQPNRKRIGKKGFASWKWIVGGKLCLLTNKFGLVTDWQIRTANVSDQEFLPLVEAVREKMIVLADIGFRRKIDQPENLKICRRGEWNDRMLIETVFSLLSQVCKLKHLRQRVWAYFEMRLAFTVAVFQLAPTMERIEF